jgi:hypothetical protein
MTAMIEIQDGLYIQPHKVIAVKSSSLQKHHCTIFLSGHSAVDGGFVVDRDAEDVVDEIDKALAEEVSNGKRG